ncbi:hypothetical protein HDU81_002784 [Chytriomyces hyalinus]|nr:hypothetical protein HDU81_002784 [Chytriomyces hyalinus]
MNFIGEIFGGVNVETPAFTLLHQASEYQVRRYPAAVVIKTPMAEGNTGSSFRALAGFIFGKNQDASVAPVKPIAMTAPVVSTKNEMAFILPKEYDSIDKVPTPITSSGVKVEEQQSCDMAVLPFTGDGWSQYNGKLEELKNALNRDQIAFNESSAVLNQFNPPWTLPFMRTNEVAVKLDNPFVVKTEAAEVK